MGKYLDLNDVAGGHPVAERELRALLDVVGAARSLLTFNWTWEESGDRLTSAQAALSEMYAALASLAAASERGSHEAPSDVASDVAAKDDNSNEEPSGPDASGTRNRGEGVLVSARESCGVGVAQAGQSGGGSSPPTHVEGAYINAHGACATCGHVGPGHGWVTSGIEIPTNLIPCPACYAPLEEDEPADVAGRREDCHQTLPHRGPCPLSPQQRGEGVG